MPSRLVTLEVQNTHLYPGARGRILDLPRDAHLSPRPACVVVFADRTTVHARLAACGEAFALDVPAYITARGTAVRAKSWLIAVEETKGGCTQVRVKQRFRRKEIGALPIAL